MIAGPRAVRAEMAMRLGPQQIVRDRYNAGWLLAGRAEGSLPLAKPSAVDLTKEYLK